MSREYPKIAVVGHTNTGKTSLIRTLLRNATFGDVKDEAATTRDVTRIDLMLLASGNWNCKVADLYDSPGLERATDLYDEHFADKRDHREPNQQLIASFLQDSQANALYEQEAKVLRLILDADVALYVIDVRKRVRTKNMDEIKLLSMSGKPLLPVLNFTSSKRADSEAWEKALRHLGLHMIVKFDAVVLDEENEIDLFEGIARTSPGFKEAANKLIADRKELKEELILSSSQIIARFMVDLAGCLYWYKSKDEEARTEAQESLIDAAIIRQKELMLDLLRNFRFDPADYPLDDDDYEGIRNWSQVKRLFDNWTQLFEESRKAGAGAVAGMLLGAGLDVLFAGLTFGLFTALGALLGGGAVFFMNKNLVELVAKKARGEDFLFLPDDIIAKFAGQAVVYTKALLGRGHADSYTASASKTGHLLFKPGRNTKKLIRKSRRPELSKLSQDKYQRAKEYEAVRLSDAFTPFLVDAIQRPIEEDGEI